VTPWVLYIGEQGGKNIKRPLSLTYRLGQLPKGRDASGAGFAASPRRNSARIDEAVLRGCPTGPSGAAEPARRKGMGEREVQVRGGRGGGGVIGTVHLCADAAGSSHGIAVRLCAVVTAHRLPADPLLPSTTLPSPPLGSWSSLLNHDVFAAFGFMVIGGQNVLEHASRLLFCCRHSYGPTFVAAPIPLG